ncbi:hypothetical protein GALL_296860 [mine drainage metagenome]|uniref:Uncharacterized protein n=1 Tax=mine drainage metagenome TaxID=410659 RepID=A0A1J5QXY5_9ZZZZ
MVETTVARMPTLRELPNASHTCGAPHGFFHASRVKPFQTRFDFPALLNENATVYPIGTMR